MLHELQPRMAWFGTDVRVCRRRWEVELVDEAKVPGEMWRGARVVAEELHRVGE